MIFVGGASGAGKTTVLEDFTRRHPEFIHLKASKILEAQGCITIDASIEDLEFNQNVLRRHLSTLTILNKTILDGHILIPYQKSLYKVPYSFFVDLPITAFVFLWTENWRITSRKGIDLSPTIGEELNVQRRTEFLHMQAVAERMGRPVANLNSTQVGEIEKTLLRYGMA